MAKVVSETQRDWSQYLAACVLAYNTSTHESTSYTPYYLMHGREVISPLDLQLETPQPDPPTDMNDYAAELVSKLQTAFRLVAQHEGGKMERMKRDYDANVKPKAYRCHEFVWYYYPRRRSGRTPKWARYYVGPYRIERVLNDVNFVIRRSPRAKAIVVHIDKLRKFYGERPSCWPPSDDDPPSEIGNSSLPVVNQTSLGAGDDGRQGR